MIEQDQTTLAYINLNAVLGTIPKLLELDEKAREAIAGVKPIALCFSVKNGPVGVLSFKEGKCTYKAGNAPCDLKLNLSSCELFNRLVDGEKITPIPSKGFSRLSFVLDKKTEKAPFTKLTDRLKEVMRATPEALADPKFKELSTTLMCYTIAAAISEVGNHDFIGKFSAKNTGDGEIGFEVKGGPAVTIIVKDHKLSTIITKCSNPSALLEFGSMEIARNVFDNVENSMACVCEGKISMTGMIGNIDNINRMLDRVSAYLA